MYYSYDEVEKSLDLIINTWNSKYLYSEVSEGQIRKVLYKVLEPMIVEIRALEDDLKDFKDFGMLGMDEVMIELSSKKMDFIKKVADLCRID